MSNIAGHEIINANWDDDDESTAVFNMLFMESMQQVVMISAILFLSKSVCVEGSIRLTFQ